VENFCAKFGVPSCIGFGDISCGKTDRQTNKRTHTNADENLTHVTAVGVDNNQTALGKAYTSQAKSLRLSFSCVFLTYLLHSVMRAALLYFTFSFHVNRLMDYLLILNLITTLSMTY